MSVDEREVVKGMYPKSKRWASRVDRMSDGQAHAIYVRYMNTLDKQCEDVPDPEPEEGEF